MEILLAILLGGFFGFALYLVGATSFRNILKMLRLEDLTLAKTILFAIGLSSTLLAITAMLGIFDVSHMSVKAMNLGVIVGGLIFGVGFAVAGTCPGTCVGAVASRKTIKRAVVAIFGGLIGAFAYSMTYGSLKEMGLFSALDLGKMTLFTVSEKYPAVFNIGFIGLLVVGILFMIGSYFLPKRILE